MPRLGRPPVVLRGRLWPGGGAPAYDDGLLLVGATGLVEALGPAAAMAVPAAVPVLGGPGSWVGPALIDGHVHLAFGDPALALAGGVAAVRDLGAPPERAAGWRSAGSPVAGSPFVAVAGPVLTAPGGYPSRSWGVGGFAGFLHDPAQAARLVRRLAADVDLVKVALEPGGGQPVPEQATVRAVVLAAHEHGLAVTAHALTAGMVRLALAAGVDELAHTPVEPLPAELVDAVAAAGIPVVSTLQTFVDGGEAAAAQGALANARALHAAGVRLVYGTDLGNAGTRPGAEPRELARLAESGLGPEGALRAATDVAAGLAGIRGRSGRLVVGEPAAAALLTGDPLADPDAWLQVAAVVADGRVSLAPYRR